MKVFFDDFCVNTAMLILVNMLVSCRLEQFPYQLIIVQLAKDTAHLLTILNILNFLLVIMC